MTPTPAPLTKGNAFKFKKFGKKTMVNSPGSLPSLGSTPHKSPIIISSNEELERSMIELENRSALRCQTPINFCYS